MHRETFYANFIQKLPGEAKPREMQSKGEKWREGAFKAVKAPHQMRQSGNVQRESWWPQMRREGMCLHWLEMIPPTMGHLTLPPAKGW